MRGIKVVRKDAVNTGTQVSEANAVKAAQTSPVAQERVMVSNIYAWTEETRLSKARKMSEDATVFYGGKQ